MACLFSPSTLPPTLLPAPQLPPSPTTPPSPPSLLHCLLYFYHFIPSDSFHIVAVITTVTQHTVGPATALAEPCNSHPCTGRPTHCSYTPLSLHTSLAVARGFLLFPCYGVLVEFLIIIFIRIFLLVEDYNFSMIMLTSVPNTPPSSPPPTLSLPPASALVPPSSSSQAARAVHSSSRAGWKTMKVEGWVRTSVIECQVQFFLGFVSSRRPPFPRNPDIILR